MFHPLIGHERQREWFRHAISSGRLTSTFLFVGPEGIGKRTFALTLAQSLFCEQVPPQKLQPCCNCSSCLQVMAGTHPDILRVQRPAEKTTIPIELLIGTRESRMQEGMCHDIRMTPMSGGRRIAIIDDCDFLEAQSANALLKTLEEPPPKAIIILIGTSLQRQLPTIRSRCQVVRFDLPSAQHAAQILRFRITEEELPEEEIQAALQLAEGNLAQATVYLDQSVRDFQKQLNGLLAQPIPEAVKLAKLVTQFVEAAGTEAPPRRERMRIVSDLAAAHYRERIREEGASRHINRLYRCMEIRQHVDRNINQATIIESWAEELQRG